jgi:hypothetical protein
MSDLFPSLLIFTIIKPILSTIIYIGWVAMASAADLCPENHCFGCKLIITYEGGNINYEVYYKYSRKHLVFRQDSLHSSALGKM